MVTLLSVLDVHRNHWPRLGKRKWGLFIGLSAAAFWNYTTLFVNTFFVSGLKQALLLMQSGHLPRPDLFIAVPAWVGNLLVIAGCCVLYVQRLEKLGRQYKASLHLPGQHLRSALAGSTEHFAELCLRTWQLAAFGPATPR